MYKERKKKRNCVIGEERGGAHQAIMAEKGWAWTYLHELLKKNQEEIAQEDKMSLFAPA